MAPARRPSNNRDSDPVAFGFVSNSSNARSERAHLVRIFPPAPHGGVDVTAFEGSRMTLGRGSNCSITLDMRGLDDEHARVERPRTGTALRVQDLDSGGGTFVQGRRVPKRGLDLPVGGTLRLGGAVFVHTRWTDEAAQMASWSPLPGPVNSCAPSVVEGLRRLQKKRYDAGTFWICGASGAGRSVVIEHLRALVEISSGGDWITGGVEFVPCATPPADADPTRTLVLPPLKDRPEDLLVLLAALNGGALPRLTARLVEGLALYDWPGNIRELRLALARAHDPRYAPPESARWTLELFPDCARFAGEATGGEDPLTLQTPERPLPTTVKGMRALLDAHSWRIFQVAAATGRSRRSVLDHVFDLGIREPWERPA